MGEKVDGSPSVHGTYVLLYRTRGADAPIDLERDRLKCGLGMISEPIIAIGDGLLPVGD